MKRTELNKLGAGMRIVDTRTGNGCTVLDVNERIELDNGKSLSPNTIMRWFEISTVKYRFVVEIVEYVNGKDLESLEVMATSIEEAKEMIENYLDRDHKEWKLFGYVENPDVCGECNKIVVEVTVEKPQQPKKEYAHVEGVETLIIPAIIQLVNEYELVELKKNKDHYALRVNGKTPIIVYQRKNGIKIGTTKNIFTEDEINYLETERDAKVTGKYMANFKWMTNDIEEVRNIIERVIDLLNK